MNIRRAIPVALLAALTVLALPHSSAAAEPYEIDVILPMTGFGGFIGQGATQGLVAAETVINKTGGINGQPIKFVVHDDQSSPQVTLQLANAIIAQGKQVFMGAAFAAQCNAIAPLVKDGPVLYCITPSVHPDPGSNIFSIDTATADQEPVAIRYFREHGITRFAEITASDASGQDGERAIDATFAEPANKGLTIVDREHFATSDISVAAQMSRVKASNAQLLIAFSSGTSFATILRDAQSAGLNLPVLTTNANMTIAQMNQYASFMPSDLYFPAFACVVPTAQIPDPKLRAAVAQYDATLHAQGSPPEFMQSSTYDPALIIASALRKLGTNAKSAQIRDYIANLRGFDGSVGVYDFKAYPQRGLGEPAVFIVRWDKTKGSWTAVSKPNGAPL